MKKDKIVYLEKFRVLVLFAVIVIHTVNREIFWQAVGAFL